MSDTDGSVGRWLLVGLRQIWQQQRTLFATALLYRLVGVFLLWPLWAALLQGFVSTSGEAALTNESIPRFLLSPWGLAGAVVCLPIGLTIVALELSSLMSLSYAQRRGSALSIAQAVRFSLSQTLSNLLLICRLLLEAFQWSLPLLFSLGVVGLGLLGEHDINFYLAQRPAEFYWAVACGGLITIVWGWIALPRLASFSVALPLKLLDGLSVAEALSASRTRLWPRRWRVVGLWTGWLGLQVTLSMAWTAAVYGTAVWAVPYTLTWFPALLLALGLFFLIYIMGNLLLSLFQSVSLAVLCVGLLPKSALGHQLPSDNGASLAAAAAVAGSPANQWRWPWILAGVAAAALLAGGWLLRSVPQRAPVLIIAHRGAAAAAPENTLAAFERAIQDGADYVELDVMETADGQVVVFHDKDYMKVAGVPVKVWEATYEELAQIDIGSHFSPTYREQRTPLLQEALELCRDRVRVMIELKEYGRGQRLVERVIEIVERVGMSQQVAVMSLSVPLVRETKRLRPDWTVGVLSAVAVGRLADMEADFLAISGRSATRDLLGRARQRQKPVYVWTIDSEPALLHYLSLGVDGIITNRPDAARRTREFYQELSPAERLLLEASLRLGIVPFLPTELAPSQSALAPDF